mgnify:CR=1 FL=1
MQPARRFNARTVVPFPNFLLLVAVCHLRSPGLLIQGGHRLADSGLGLGEGRNVVLQQRSALRKLKREGSRSQRVQHATYLERIDVAPSAARQ